MDRWSHKLAVVTGASSGIGLSIAKALVQTGMIVAGVSRRKHTMQEEMSDEMESQRFFPYDCDLSDERSIDDTFDRIEKEHGVIRVLVNNAGCVSDGPICEKTRKELQEVFDVNVMGLLDCTRRAVASMTAADVEGHVVNINSVQGHRVYNFGHIKSNVYSATKHAVTAISETLRNDLIGSKIRVTSISPATVDTDMLRRVGMNVRELKLPALLPQDVADAVVYVIGTPQRVEVTELTIKPSGDVRR